jgi:hypothetical protein
MHRRNQEQDNLRNQDDLGRLSNGFRETNDECRSSHRPNNRRTVCSHCQERRFSSDSGTSSFPDRCVQTTVPESPPFLDRNLAATKPIPTSSCHNPQDGLSLENDTPGSPSALNRKMTDRSVSPRPTSFARNSVRNLPAYPDSRQGNASFERLEPPLAPCSSSDTISKTIEIMPGIYVPLRGADETWKCIESDFYSPVTCFGCTAELCCIQDASYVLCPVCRVVGPMDAGAGDSGSTMGVGLGFSFDDLFRWQSEILLHQQDRRI